jgi:hypothetical protein
VRKRAKEYYASERGAIWRSEYSANYYAKPKNRMRLLARGAVLRAKKEGLPFDEAIVTLLMESPPELCACCSKRLDYSMARGRNQRGHSPSIDRTIPERGYVLSNIAVLCMRCNEIKRDATLVELRTVVDYLSALGNSAAGFGLQNLSRLPQGS